MTQRAEIERLVERLRTAFQQIQRCKRGDAPLDMQPVWDIINAVPTVVALLDDHAGFERDLENEAQSDALTALIKREEELRKVLERVIQWWPPHSEESQRFATLYGSAFGDDIRDARAALNPKMEGE